MLIKGGELQYGYNEITNLTEKAPDMLMDIGIWKMKAGKVFDFFETEKETAFLLITGTIRFRWGQEIREASRQSFFEENPSVLHVPMQTSVQVDALCDTEVLMQRTINKKAFTPVYYRSEDCRSDIFGKNMWNDTAIRIVRTVFDYGNAPYSNMVIGEVINSPGKWSSYIPHGHVQPEVYYYRFHRPEGFGAGFIGDEVFKVQNNSALCIPGGPTHPQVAAPGYPMYYCWMIRHLDGNPWVSRVDDPRYQWLLDKSVKIWPEK